MFSIQWYGLKKLPHIGFVPEKWILSIYIFIFGSKGKFFLKVYKNLIQDFNIVEKMWKAPSWLCFH